MQWRLLGDAIEVAAAEIDVSDGPEPACMQDAKRSGRPSFVGQPRAARGSRAGKPRMFTAPLCEQVSGVFKRPYGQQLPQLPLHRVSLAAAFPARPAS